ncbi:MAG: fused MFS/spermidine synthase, partial [Nitrospinota bacterium]|nr:fused MFS/spermidine synthase [Nitrospinota bacterium]
MNPSRTWVFLFFFISGATGLIYEVVWTRLLTLVMGNTQYSVATVLTVFMGGLALGSYLGGRWVDKTRDPLILYAVLEGAIGVFCLLVPFLIEGASPAFKWIYIHLNDSYTQASLFRFLICGSFLLVPTTLMGATLPVLSKFVSRKEEFIGRDVGTLYAMNTFGAVIGALTSAFLLMRLLGIQATVFIAAGLNIAIALLIILLFRRPATADHLREIGPERGSPEEVGERSSPEEFFILTAFGVSGLCALVYQVAWNRILSLLLGSSIYAFSLILTTFILGLALGTVFFSRRVHRFEDLYKVFGLQQAGIGFSALAVLPLFGEIPFVNRWVYQNV